MEFMAWLLAGVVTLPVLAFGVECWAGRRPPGPPPTSSVPPPFAVLVPAHNEATGIKSTLTAAQAELRPCDRLIVIADNCNDETAAVARAVGAEILERVEPHRRGKGFALAAGRDRLRDVPPQVVVVLDADCIPAAGAIASLAAEAARTGAAVQGLYLLRAAAGAGAMSEMSSFAFLVKNLVRQRGLQRLGGVAHLQGTGMAFPWPMLAEAALASGEIVEDFVLGLDLVLAGQSVRFAEHARFWSAAGSQSATVSQRTRWEHGTLAAARRYLPRFLRAGLMGNRRAQLLALDLMIPPLSLLTLLIGVALVCALLAVRGGAGGSLLLWLMGLVAIFATAISGAWHAAEPRPVRLWTLAHVPLYLLWKLPIYLRLVVDRQRAWVRTSRGE